MHRQGGAAAVEFALVATLFIALVVAVIELARVAFIYATAVEATRLGARVAVVCSPNDQAAVRAKMKNLLPMLTDDKISILYPASKCSAASCDPVTVSIQNLTVDAVIPLVPLRFPIPPNATSLPAESLDSTDNPLCA